jgi:hypothetical protein
MPKFFPPETLRTVPVGEAFVFVSEGSLPAEECFERHLVYIRLTRERLWSNYFADFNNIGYHEFDRTVQIVVND